MRPIDDVVNRDDYVVSLGLRILEAGRRGDEESPVSLSNHYEGYNFEKAEVEDEFTRLSDLGLVRQVNENQYYTTEVGRDYLDRTAELYDLPGFSRPIRRRVSRFVGSRILRLLKWLERDLEDPDKELEIGTDEIELEFLIAFDKRFYGYSAVLLMIAGIGVIVTACNIPVNNQLWGLLYEIFGAVVLARGVIRGPKGMSIEPTELVGRGGNRYLEGQYAPTDLAVVAENTVDAIWGGSSLVFGFVLQAIAITIF